MFYHNLIYFFDYYSNDFWGGVLIIDELIKYQNYPLKNAISLKINVRNDNKYKTIETKKYTILKKINREIFIYYEILTLCNKKMYQTRTVNR